MVSLFRIVESARGSIVIDGVDISLIGLKELRSAGDVASVTRVET